MDDKMVFLVVSTILSGIVGIFTLGIKTVLNRIKEIEMRQQEFMEEDKIRLLINDKTEGLKEQIVDLKNSIDRLHDIILEDRKSR